MKIGFSDPKPANPHDVKKDSLCSILSHHCGNSECTAEVIDLLRPPVVPFTAAQTEDKMAQHEQNSLPLS